MAKRKTGEKSRIAYRTQVFEVKLDSKAYSIILGVSAVLRQVWNEALVHRLNAFAEHIAPLYQKMRAAKAEGQLDTTVDLKRELSTAYKKYGVTLFDQINALTPRRDSDETFASVTRNWQEETLDRLNGGFSSFIALRKQGDYDARPTTREILEGRFVEITGRSGFKVKDGQIILSCGNIAEGVKLSFPIPVYQLGELGKAKRIKKFRLRRTENDLSKPGRFKIDISYEIEIPEVEPWTPPDLVFVSIGADYLGICSTRGEETVKHWRPDKYWKPEIEKVEQEMEKCIKGSRRWKRLNTARRRKQMKMAAQQKQNQRETVVHDLLWYGKHFVVTDYVVRSKKGKLADHDKVERRGMLGFNASAQNTGSFARLVAQLEEKARERGGTVVKHKIHFEGPLPGLTAREMIPQARLLQESFLASLEVGKVE